MNYEDIFSALCVVGCVYMVIKEMFNEKPIDPPVFCPDCGHSLVDDPDFVFSEDAGEEMFWNYRCSNPKCRRIFQELPKR